MMKYTTILLSLLAFLSFAGCEDLEDTYDDYAGNGPVRYLAKCTDLTVESGWERLIVKWNNKLDPNRNGVWVQCQSNTVQFDTLLPADCDSCSVNGLPDGTYNVTVAAVSESGDTALVQQGNGRPYTENHEAVLSFTRGISKYVFLKDNLVLFAGYKTDEMVDFVVHYTGTDSQPHEYSLTDNMAPYFELTEVLRGVDASQPVTLMRRGLLEGCPDTITFPAYTLNPTAMSMAADFQGRLLERYGEVDLNRTELELDYDLSSLEDILYFPNLQKLVLGKNRYYTNPNPYFVPVSQLTGGWGAEDRTAFCIDLLHELNPDFAIENYKGHYGINQWSYDFVTDMGVRTLPADFPLLNTTGFAVTADGVEVNGSALLDNDVATIWEAPVTQASASHDLIIDMKETKAVKGVKVAHAQVSTNAQNYMPSTVTVYVSTDGENWTNPCYTEGLLLGSVSGEVRLVDFATEQNVRYIRVTVNDVYYANNYSCVLGDVIPY